MKIRICRDGSMDFLTIEECFYKIRNGANIKQGKTKGGYPITRIETISNDRFNRDKMGYAGITDLGKYADYILEDGDLLMSHINSTQYLGRTVLYKNQNDEKIIHGMNLLGLKAKRNVIEPAYAKYYFYSQYFRNQIAKITKKSVNQASFSVSDLKRIKIQVPSLKEQHRIVCLFDKVNGIIDNYQSVLQKLDELVKARFIELMEGNQTNNILGDFISKYTAKTCGDKDYPVLSITKEYGIVLQSEKFKKRIASNDASKYKVVPFGKLVQGIHIDERNFAIQNLVENGIVSPAYKIWNVDESKAIPEVLAFALRTDRSMNYIRSKFSGSVKRRESITYEDFMNLPINLPDLAVQNQFMREKEQVDKSREIIQKKIDAYQELFDKLMQEYFG